MILPMCFNKGSRFKCCAILFFLAYVIFGQTHPNNPHSIEDENTLYTVFSERPKHLDPAKSYSADEYAIISQIYEPLYQYHYLKRPYELEPLTAKSLPEIIYYNRFEERLVNPSANEIAKSSYVIQLKENIYYAPHVAFTYNEGENKHEYHQIDIDGYDPSIGLYSMGKLATRELVAEDYEYQIKRLADPKIHSPIAGIMAGLIVGFSDLQIELIEWRRNNPGQQVDLRDFDLKGVQSKNKYSLEISIKGKYPQFKYWLAMPFFAPMAWEVDFFYQQDILQENNVTLDWYPVGTGAYYLSENNPNRRMVLQKNPDFHDEFYPTVGELGDEQNGYLDRAGQKLPFIDTAIYSLEKESIPMWNKFLQGYYDRSGIGSDAFDQAIQFTDDGEVELTEDISSKGITLKTTVQPSIFYWGFNMLDPVVGGYSEKHKKLRQALSIVFNVEEFISIFMNGRGVPAQGPIPVGLFGDDGLPNKVVYDNAVKQRARRSIEEAKQLLKQAGYPDGIDGETGKPLVLNLDVMSNSGPDDKAQLSWLRAQFKKLGIQLNIRATQYNRFREKVRSGQVQIYSWGWNADYPDPENFLMLLYGPNSKVKYGGENASNYQNDEYDLLYEKINQMENSPERQALIYEMVNLLREDAPWIWGFHPKSFTLSHAWNSAAKPNAMANNTLKYAKIDVDLRKTSQKKWNQANYKPILIVLFVLVVFSIPVVVTYWRKERTPPKKISDKDN
jgi:ABC-type transport system substrate-binding protein